MVRGVGLAPRVGPQFRHLRSLWNIFRHQFVERLCSGEHLLKGIISQLLVASSLGLELYFGANASWRMGIRLNR
jgi:hypothetical protein